MIDNDNLCCHTIDDMYIIDFYGNALLSYRLINNNVENRFVVRSKMVVMQVRGIIQGE